jgi:hypothetical protein
MLHCSTSQSDKKISISYEDQFSYHTKGGVLSASSRYAFLWQVIKYLEQSSNEGANTGDFVRLCALLKDLALTRRRSSKIEDAVGELLDRVLPGSPHRIQQEVSDILRTQADEAKKKKAIKRTSSRSASSKARGPFKPKKGRSFNRAGSSGRDQQRPGGGGQVDDERAKPREGGGSKLMKREPRPPKLNKGRIRGTV